MQAHAGGGFYIHVDAQPYPLLQCGFGSAYSFTTSQKKCGIGEPFYNCRPYAEVSSTNAWIYHAACDTKIDFSSSDPNVTEMFFETEDELMQTIFNVGKNNQSVLPGFKPTNTYGESQLAIYALDNSANPTLEIANALEAGKCPTFPTQTSLTQAFAAKTSNVSASTNPRKLSASGEPLHLDPFLLFAACSGISTLVQMLLVPLFSVSLARARLPASRMSKQLIVLAAAGIANALSYGFFLLNVVNNDETVTRQTLAYVGAIVVQILSVMQKTLTTQTTVDNWYNWVSAVVDESESYSHPLATEIQLAVDATEIPGVSQGQRFGLGNLMAATVSYFLPYLQAFYCARITPRPSITRSQSCPALPPV